MSGTLRRRKSLGDELNELRVEVQKLKIGRTAREDVILLNAVRLVQDRFDLINNDMKLRMPMDNSIVDRSGNDHDGTLVGAPTFVTGKKVFAIAFDGVDQGVTIADNIDFRIASGEDISISFWIKTTVNPTAQDIIEKGVGADFWLVKIDNGVVAGGIQFQVFDGTNNARRFSASAINDGAFHHVVCRYDASTGILTIFIDGVDDSSASFRIDRVNQIIPNTETVDIARGTLSGGFLDADIDEIRFYKRHLTADEALELFVFPVPQFHEIEPDAALTGFWGFEGHSEDLSGFANNGVRNGGPVYVDARVGKGLDFDGIDNYVSVTATSSLEPVGKLTVCAWVRLDLGAAPTTILSVVRKKGGAAPSGGYFISLRGDVVPKRFEFGIFQTDGVGKAGTFTYDDTKHRGNLIFLTLVADGTDVKGFIDGVLGGTLSYDGTIGQGGNELLIGAFASQAEAKTRFWDGIIDEVRVYKDRVLTLDEIQELFTAGRPPLRQISLFDEVRANLNKSSVGDELFSLADVAPTSVECTEFFVGTVPAGPTNCSVIAGRQGIVGVLDGV